MNEDDLGRLWTALEPGGIARQRIDTRVQAWLEARDTPLLFEWLALFRVAPISTTGLVAVSTVATAPPFFWLARAVLSAAG